MNSFFIFKFRTSIVLLTVLLGTTLAACAVPGPQAAVSGALDSNVAPVAEWTVEAGEPGGIAVGPGGEVFVIINHDYRVVKYSAEGELLGGWDTDGEAGGIAVGPGGEVYVQINNDYRVVKYQ